MSRKRSLPKLSTEVEWDYVADDAPRCPACGSAWQGAPTVYVNVELGVALVAGHPFHVNDEQARILQVLRSSCSRWLPLAEMMELAYSDRPECDVPLDPGAIETALRFLKKRLTEAGYHIQSRRNFGYRLAKIGADK